MSARDMFFKKDQQFSHAEERAFAREDLIFNVTEDLLVLLEEMGVTKAELARRLGRNKSAVSQMLNGGRNMTLGSLSDICFEIGVTPEIKLPVGKVEAQKYVVESKNTRVDASFNGGNPN